MIKQSVALALAALAACASAQDVTYKGVPLGATMDEFKSKLPDHECLSKRCFYLASTCKAGFDVCRDRNSFGGIRILSAHSDFRDGKFVAVRMTFDTSDFNALTGAAKERFGEPTKAKDSQVKTKAGATFDNRELAWESKSMLLRISKYGSNVSEGYLSLYTPEEEALQQAEWEAKKKAGAKDF